MSKIPVSVLVVTKNEQDHIARCLKALSDFDEVIVIDSYSDDNTVELAQAVGAIVKNFKWNDSYPKKRQWCLDNIEIKHDWVFWVDADEVLTSDLIEEIRCLFGNKQQCAGYFVKGKYIWQEKCLEHGLMNNKLALFDRRKIEFPVIDDLDIKGMGEIEGHYQPILKSAYSSEKIGQLTAVLFHYAYDDESQWLARHKRYAHWEAQMSFNEAWPKDPVAWRDAIKKLTRTSIFRPYMMFIYSYIIRLGFLDGNKGYKFALSRKKYCEMVLKELRK